MCSLLLLGRLCLSNGRALHCELSERAAAERASLPLLSLSHEHYSNGVAGTISLSHQRRSSRYITLR